MASTQIPWTLLLVCGRVHGTKKLSFIFVSDPLFHHIIRSFCSGYDVPIWQVLLPKSSSNSVSNGLHPLNVVGAPVIQAHTLSTSNMGSNRTVDSIAAIADENPQGNGGVSGLCSSTIRTSRVRFLLQQFSKFRFWIVGRMSLLPFLHGFLLASEIWPTKLKIVTLDRGKMNNWPLSNEMKNLNWCLHRFFKNTDSELVGWWETKQRYLLD